ncbi:Metallo-dependent phosphatase [Dacryopinax primogenitus]|uniref:Metallo-dependent phosphatase n=1 Tax=Dacryopinax primogenitus (strain DJM 731) TaxID=1858805 RepID=M5G2U6_DACPD|nr:Metallo-dependent phosphatase [Dacryopinax primogenitus]EJT98082.1 Metallo-dependent phosphatase [Dacryopinax primogenitus]
MPPVLYPSAAGLLWSCYERTMHFLTVLLFGTALSSPLPRQNGLLGVLDWSLKRKLTFNTDGEFKVVSFSDMHFGERNGDGTFASWGPEQDTNTTIVHSIILDQEKPDYVVFNGDLMTGENVFAFNATGYLDQMYGPTIQRGIPFSSTHGNHDNSNNITHLEEIEYEIAHYGGLSYTRADVGPRPYGCGNYWVLVYAREEDSAPAVVMWFFDSTSFVPDVPAPVPAEANYYWIDENTVPQYVETQSGLMKAVWGSLPPSLVFVHIPFQHSDDLCTLPTVGDHDDDPDPATQGFLNNAYTGLDLPAFQAIIGLAEGKNEVLAVTSGHDHGDSWCARSYNASGLALCFDGHSGYGGYVTPHSEVRNRRVFNLRLEDLSAVNGPMVETWNSYENKTTNDYFVLGPDFMKEYL